MKQFIIPLLSVSLFLGSSLAHAMKPKTAKDFQVDEDSIEITYNTLDFANYLMSDQDGEPSEDDLKLAFGQLISDARSGLYEPYEFIFMLTDRDEKKTEEILQADESTAASLFVNYFKKHQETY